MRSADSDAARMLSTKPKQAPVMEPTVAPKAMFRRRSDVWYGRPTKPRAFVGGSREERAAAADDDGGGPGAAAVVPPPSDAALALPPGEPGASSRSSCRARAAAASRFSSRRTLSFFRSMSSLSVAGATGITWVHGRLRLRSQEDIVANSPLCSRSRFVRRNCIKIEQVVRQPASRSLIS